MTPGDVIDSLLYDPNVSGDDCEALTLLWVGLVKKLKPEQAHMPLSPLELAELRVDLESQARRIRMLLAAISEAKARRPIHFRVVEAGGR